MMTTHITAGGLLGGILGPSKHSGGGSGHGSGYEGYGGGHGQPYGGHGQQPGHAKPPKNKKHGGGGLGGAGMFAAGGKCSVFWYLGRVLTRFPSFLAGAGLLGGLLIADAFDDFGDGFDGGGDFGDF